MLKIVDLELRQWRREIEASRVVHWLSEFPGDLKRRYSKYASILYPRSDGGGRGKSFSLKLKIALLQTVCT